MDGNTDGEVIQKKKMEGKNAQESLIHHNAAKHRWTASGVSGIDGLHVIKMDGNTDGEVIQKKKMEGKNAQESLIHHNAAKNVMPKEMICIAAPPQTLVPEVKETATVILIVL